MLILNLPLAGLFAQVLRVPYSVLYPIVLALCITGVYAAQISIDDLWMLTAFGALGYVLKRYELPIAHLWCSAPCWSPCLRTHCVSP